MAIKHNNVVPNVHFRKWWQKYIRTWFNQAGRKKSRRVARQQKAAKAFPRPAGKLRPVVRAATIRYNHKLRAGRGFTVTELKKAGIPKKKAASIGIAVDARRKSQCEESLNLNVDRLKEYMSKLVVFPLKSGKKLKNGDSKRGDLSKNAAPTACKTVLPVPNKVKRTASVKLSDMDKSKSAYKTLRAARVEKKYFGKNLVRKQKAEAKKKEK